MNGRSELRILIADDDYDLVNLVSFAFRSAGYDTVSVGSGSEALAAMDREPFSVVVLDINMPPPNGLEVCEILRKHSNVPVMMLSARDREDDLLHALDAGADAYLTKPFSPKVLVTRVGALIRRAASAEPRIVSASDFKLDINESQLVHPSGVISLTRLEVRLLHMLMINAGKTIGQSELLSEVWSGFSAANRNTLKQVVFRLRRKLSSVQEASNALQTIDGRYMWKEDAAVSTVEISLPSERTAR